MIGIQDSGIGIPRDALQKLGRPFEQVESQLTKTHHGSGLGLAIAKSLVELHGGAMRIRSTLGRRHDGGGAPAARRTAAPSKRSGATATRLFWRWCRRIGARIASGRRSYSALPSVAAASRRHCGCKRRRHKVRP